MRFWMTIAIAGLLFAPGCITSRKSEKLTDAEFRQLIKEYNEDRPKYEQLECAKTETTGSHYRKWRCHKKYSNTEEDVKVKDLMLHLERLGGHQHKGG